MATGPHLILDIREKRFEGAPVALYENLCLEIAPSSVIALVGPSGIGKSTLLRLIAGIDSSFEGRILIDGSPAASASPPGFVFQDPRLLPWLTAQDNIRAVDPSCSPQRAQAELDRVGLGSSAQMYPHQLSGGMQRRVALARALAVNARLLLLDEPFISLDRTLVDEIQDLFTRLVDETRPTVVFVSHLTDDAARLADRAILLNHRPARVVADISMPVAAIDRTEQIIADYRALLEAPLAGA